ARAEAEGGVQRGAVEADAAGDVEPVVAAAGGGAVELDDVGGLRTEDEVLEPLDGGGGAAGAEDRPGAEGDRPGGAARAARGPRVDRHRADGAVDHQRPTVDDGAAGVGVGPGQGPGTGPDLDDGARSANDPGEGGGAVVAADRQRGRVAERHVVLAF